MTAMLFNRVRTGVRTIRSRWGWKVPVIVVVLLVAVAAAGFFVQRRRGEQPAEDSPEVLSRVTVQPFGELVQGGIIEKVAVIEAANWAPLVARSGGRVTDVRVQLGRAVSAGQVVVAIDGAGEANPARAQAAAASESLQAFEAIAGQALVSTDNAVAIAGLSFEAAEAGRRLSEDTVAKSREAADNAVLKAEFAWQDAWDTGDDVLIRTADLALKAARLAQDQATLARNTANRQSSDAVKQARQAVTGASLAKEKLMADLDGQRVGLAGQVAVAQERVRLAQVTSPLSGQVNRLSVRPGDFVRLGQQVGEVVSSEGARVMLDVTAGVRERLNLGLELNLEVRGRHFTGEIVRLAGAPGVDSALWQVDIFIAAMPQAVRPGDLVVVEMPLGLAADGTFFIPLDAVTVRQDGIVLFTVDEAGVVQEHVIEVVGFASDYVESRIDLADDVLVVVGGNRTLRADQKVEISGS